jgi:hypothetical protein
MCALLGTSVVTTDHLALHTHQTIMLWVHAAEHTGPGKPTFDNTMFAEQEISLLAPLKKSAIHMPPFTLLWLVKLVLYKQSKSKKEAWRSRNRSRVQPVGLGRPAQ